MNDEQTYPRIFTPLFERLQSCMQPEAAFKALATKIAKALRNHLYKKNLWRAKPELLGEEYKDYTTWNNAEAFEILCLACYIDVICKRFDSLQQKLSETDNIDGYIHRNIGFFLYDAQRKADPVGHKVAIKVRLAVNCCATERGIITVAELKKNKVHNETLLIFSPSKEDSEPSVLADTIKQILHHNHTWTSEIIYKLASLGRISQKNQVQICDIVADIAQQMPTAGINRCQFKSLVDVMKQEVRAVNPQTCVSEEAADEIPFEPDDIPDEDFECWRVWCHQMKAAIEKSDYQQRVREKLPKVFAEREAAVEQLEPSPPQAQIAKHLGMAVSTVNDLLKRLRELDKTIGKPNDCDSRLLDYLIGQMLK
jgi:hypothetical protein